METKEIKDAIDSGIKSVQAEFDKKFDNKTELLKKELEARLEGIKTGQTKEDVDLAVEAATKAIQKDFDELATKVNKQKFTESNEPVSFKSAIKEGLEEKKNDLSSLKEKRSSSASILLKNENLDFGNFAGTSYESITTDRSRGMYQSPFAPLWLRSILPNSSTTNSTIYYMRENGGTGEAGVWDGTGTIDTLTDKPGVNFNFEDVTETVKWIAGITRVKREMLDDVAWLQSYISRQLTVGKRGLFVAENTQIYNTLTTNSTAYDGGRTVPVEMIYDAAFGQLKDNYHNVTTILMNHRDVVNLIAFNQASGSGEYDLPNGTVVIIGGQLYISGVPVIGVPNVTSGTFLAFDRNATEFVSRMNPEVRFFEQDRDNVPKNLVTVRAEERMTTLVYDTSAIISGTFATEPVV